LSFLNGNYLVIKTPTPHNFFRGSRSQNDVSEEPHGYFGKSKQGIYYTVVHGYQLSVWVLQEATNTGRALEWELRYQRDLETTFQGYYNKHPRRDVVGKSWTLDPNEEDSSERGDNGWDSSDDNIIDEQEQGIDCKDGHIKCYYGMDFLGYHPQKEIVFLGSRYKGFSYYLGSSKLQYLGLLYPNGKYHIPIRAPTLESFVYTPCVDDLLPTHNNDL
jgi:hypothetical protein